MFRNFFNHNMSLKNSNLVLAALVLLLVAIGMNVLLSASAMIAIKNTGAPYHYFIRQFFYSFIGIIFMLTASQIPYSFWRRIAWPLYFFSVFLLILVFIPPFSRSAGGASRWLALPGFSFQPSDLARFSVLLVLSRIYADKEEISVSLVVTTFFILAISGTLIFKEPDFGTAAHLSVTVLFFLFFTGFSTRIIFSILGLFIPLSIYTVLYEPYRLERLRAWLNPEKYRYEEGYQILASYRSYLSGGWSGMGLGESLERHRLIARHTDFIFARVAEDLGMLGIIAILSIYFVITFYGFHLLLKVRDDFARLLGTAILLLFILQAIFNISVTMNLLPTTGINLPLFSAGGSSLIVFLFMFGILLNITRHRE